jgi:hypothetical protein
MDVELGSLDSNMVKLTVVEDVFALSAAVYAAPPPSGWVNPNNPPAACPQHVLIEAPYWELAQRLGETDAASLPATFAAVLATGTRPTPDAINAKLLTNPTNTGYVEAGTVDFCPTATLSAAVAPAVTTIPITGGVDLDIVRVGSYALIDNEFVSITSVSSSSLGVGRGVLDSIAAPHALGARVYCIDDVAETDSVEYASGETARIKLLPTTGRGTLLEASATAQTLVVGTRQVRPYPPGQFRINNLAYPDAVRGDQDITASWTYRDRLQQTASLIPELFGSIGPEAGTTYTARVLLQNGNSVTSLTGILGQTHTFTLASMGTNYGRIRIELFSVRDGYDSHQKHDWLFTRAGYGAAYGYAYGGV